VWPFVRHGDEGEMTSDGEDVPSFVELRWRPCERQAAFTCSLCTTGGTDSAISRSSAARRGRACARLWAKYEAESVRQGGQRVPRDGYRGSAAFHEVVDARHHPVVCVWHLRRQYRVGEVAGPRNGPHRNCDSGTLELLIMGDALVAKRIKFIH
jgi:hypothetical protein